MKLAGASLARPRVGIGATAMPDIRSAESVPRGRRRVGRFEHRPQRQLHLQRIAHPRHQLHRQQRVTAQRKKIIRAPTPSPPPAPTPSVHSTTPSSGVRAATPSPLPPTPHSGAGKPAGPACRSASAAGRLQHRPARRQHVLRQPRCQVAPAAPPPAPAPTAAPSTPPAAHRRPPRAPPPPPQPPARCAISAASISPSSIR